MELNDIQKNLILLSLSNLIEELNVKEIKDNFANLTSNLYNQIKLTNNFDLMLKYGTKLEDTDILNNTYPDLPYLTYDNTFSLPLFLITINFS